MSYKRQNFTDGQVLKAEHLNKMESGIENSVESPVTAQVGQTIIVKEVDANGKPTKWEAAGYQPRTHWKSLETVDIIPQTTFTAPMNEALGVPLYQFTIKADIEVGKEYTVFFDGVEYVRTAKEGLVNTFPCVYIGNEVLFGNNTGEPFAFAVIPSANINGVVCFDVNEHTIQISGEQEVTHKIPDEYVSGNDFKVEIARDTSVGSYYSYQTLDEMLAAHRAGKNLYAMVYDIITYSDNTSTNYTGRYHLSHVYDGYARKEITFFGILSSTIGSAPDKLDGFRILEDSDTGEVTVTRFEN